MLTTGSTPLDRYIWRFYKSLGLKVGFNPSTSSFDRSFYVATYGEMIVQAHYPEILVGEMDAFLKKARSIEKMKLKELSDVINSKTKVELTVRNYRWRNISTSRSQMK